QNPDGDPALMVTDTENDRLGLINLTDNTIAFLDVAVSRPKSVDWFGNFIAVADENRIQLLKVNGDGMTVSTIAEGIKANSVFFDSKYNIYLTTQNSNKIQVIWYNRVSGYRDHAEVLGGREESGYQNGCADSAAFAAPLAVATYFGDLVIADTDNQALRLLS